MKCPWLLVGPLIAALLPLAAILAANSQPNIVFLLADDQQD